MDGGWWAVGGRWGRASHLLLCARRHCARRAPLWDRPGEQRCMWALGGHGHEPLLLDGGSGGSLRDAGHAGRHGSGGGGRADGSLAGGRCHPSHPSRGALSLPRRLGAAALGCPSASRPGPAAAPRALWLTRPALRGGLVWVLSARLVHRVVAALDDPLGGVAASRLRRHPPWHPLAGLGVLLARGRKRFHKRVALEQSRPCPPMGRLRLLGLGARMRRHRCHGHRAGGWGVGRGGAAAVGLR